MNGKLLRFVQSQSLERRKRPERLTSTRTVDRRKGRRMRRVVAAAAASIPNFSFCDAGHRLKVIFWSRRRREDRTCPPMRAAAGPGQSGQVQAGPGGPSTDWVGTRVVGEWGRADAQRGTRVGRPRRLDVVPCRLVLTERLSY